MQEAAVFIGVDVSKVELVISTGRERQPCSVANDAPSIGRWLRELSPGALIAMESTGRHHALLAHLASQAGFKVYVLNARDVFFYARALGTRGKTDGVDSGVIARYLAEHHAHLHPWRAASSLQQRLQELLQPPRADRGASLGARSGLQWCRYAGHRDKWLAGGLRQLVANHGRQGAGTDRQRCSAERGVREAANDHRHRATNLGVAGYLVQPLRLHQRGRSWWPTADWILGPTTRAPGADVVG